MQNLKLISGQKTDDTDNLERIDFNIWVALIFLCCFGLIMVLSASSFKCASSKECNYDSMYYFKRQTFFVVAGFLGILGFRHYDYRKLMRLSWIAYVVSIICIFLLLTPLGISVNGAKRWLGRGAVRFQVAEVVKIAVILFLANMVTTYSKYLSKVQLTIYLWLAGGIPAALLFKISNDLSSAIIVLGITFGISFICTKTIKLHAGVLATAVAAAAAYILNIWNHLPTPEELSNTSFRVGRIAAWLAPERYSDNQGYQILQALYAIGNGGFLGKNLGNSVQKLYAIPEAHTDMIFSIVCEELGLLGATLLISLFLYLLYQLLRLALSTKDLFGSVIVLGIFLHISLQTVINLAVNVNLFPNTGLTLPFISYGGTSVFLLLMEMSIVFSIIQIRTSKAADRPPVVRRPSRAAQLLRTLSGPQSVSGARRTASGSSRTHSSADRRTAGRSAGARGISESRTASKSTGTRTRSRSRTVSRSSVTRTSADRFSDTRTSSQRRTVSESSGTRASSQRRTVSGSSGARTSSNRRTVSVSSEIRSSSGSRSSSRQNRRPDSYN